MEVRKVRSRWTRYRNNIWVLYEEAHHLYEWARVHKNDSLVKKTNWTLTWWDGSNWHVVDAPTLREGKRLGRMLVACALQGLP